MREVTLFLHLLGMGLLTTTLAAGWILNRQYRQAPDLKTKAVILRSGKVIGLLSPIGMLILLITGVGNMHALGVGFLDLGWLSAKVTLFVFALIAGIGLSVVSRKRGALVAAMALGEDDPGAAAKLSGYDRMIGGGSILLRVLFIAILYLSVVGRLDPSAGVPLGGQ